MIRVDSLEQQIGRAYAQYQSRDSDILKNNFLQSLKGMSFHLDREFILILIYMIQLRI
jgi:hypothetical protein